MCPPRSGFIVARCPFHNTTAWNSLAVFTASRAFAEFANCVQLVGHTECAGLNRHVVGDERALQERRVANPSWLESCRRHREVSVEA
jgi:hypothetical protein